MIDLSDLDDENNVIGEYLDILKENVINYEK